MNSVNSYTYSPKNENEGLKQEEQDELRICIKYYSIL